MLEMLEANFYGIW